jgi:hypothetical protein
MPNTELFSCLGAMVENLYFVEISFIHCSKISQSFPVGVARGNCGKGISSVFSSPERVEGRVANPDTFLPGAT